MTLVSKSMVYRALSDKTYLLLGLCSPLNDCFTHSNLCFVKHPLTKMKRLLQCCGSVAATLQQLDMYAATGGDKVAN